MDEEIARLWRRMKTVILVEGSHISADCAFREVILKFWLPGAS